MKRITAIALIVGVLGAVIAPTQLGAQDKAPQFLQVVCFDPTQGALRLYWRAVCDDAAENSGYRFGILRPSKGDDPVLECSNPGEVSHVCEGQGAVNQ